MQDLINSLVAGCMESKVTDYPQLQALHLQTPHLPLTLSSLEPKTVPVRERPYFSASWVACHRGSTGKTRAQWCPVTPPKSLLPSPSGYRHLAQSCSYFESKGKGVVSSKQSTKKWLAEVQPAIKLRNTHIFLSSHMMGRCWSSAWFLWLGTHHFACYYYDWFSLGGD